MAMIVQNTAGGAVMYPANSAENSMAGIRRLWLAAVQDVSEIYYTGRGAGQTAQIASAVQRAAAQAQPLPQACDAQASGGGSSGNILEEAAQTLPQTEQTDQINQTNQINQIGQSGQSGQSIQSNQSDQSDQNNQSNQTLPPCFADSGARDAEHTATSAPGRTYEHEILFHIYGHSNNLQPLLDRHRALRWLAAKEDRHGRLWLIGTMEEPLRLEWDELDEGTPAGQTCFEVRLSATCRRPALRVAPLADASSGGLIEILG